MPLRDLLSTLVGDSVADAGAPSTRCILPESSIGPSRRCDPYQTAHSGYRARAMRGRTDAINQIAKLRLAYQASAHDQLIAFVSSVVTKFTGNFSDLSPDSSLVLGRQLG